MTMTEASQLLGLSTPQQLNNKFNNKKVSLSDLKDFLGIMGYDYEIIIKKRSGSFWVLPDLFYYAILETLEVFTFSLPYFLWMSSKDIFFLCHFPDGSVEKCHFLRFLDHLKPNFFSSSLYGNVLPSTHIQEPTTSILTPSKETILLITFLKASSAL